MLIGSHCEIVLHSLQDLKCSAIRIANGEHTGRQIGSLITDLALRMLHDMTERIAAYRSAILPARKAVC